jgi:Flp pilus assembly protein TadD
MTLLLQKPLSEETAFARYLKAGWQAFENSNYEEALALLRKAAVADLRRPEPWYCMGLIQERQDDRKSAAYCFYMACDLNVGFQPAKQALGRLGYLNLR